MFVPACEGVRRLVRRLRGVLVPASVATLDVLFPLVSSMRATSQTAARRSGSFCHVRPAWVLVCSCTSLATPCRFHPLASSGAAIALRAALVHVSALSRTGGSGSDLSTLCCVYDKSLRVCSCRGRAVRWRLAVPCPVSVGRKPAATSSYVSWSTGWGR